MNEDKESIQREAETTLAHTIEARLHEIGRELGQDFDMTQAFVKRVFAGLPAHVQPGSVKPYSVEQAPQTVIDGTRIPTKSSFPPDITR